MSHVHASSGLIGRHDERTLLGTWLNDAVNGHPRVVIVRGAPGMGKTRLLRWLLDEARATGALTAWGAAVEGVHVPMLAAAPILAAIPGGTEALEASDPVPGPWGGSTSQSLTRAVSAVCQAAEQEPVVVIVDDLQWADEATLAFVQHLSTVVGTSATPLRILLAVNVRAGDGAEPGRRAAHRLTREASARQLDVAPFDEVEVRELCRDLTGTYPSRTELRRLVDLTGGSPLLLRAHLTTGSDTQRTDAHAGLDLLEGRFAELPRSTRRAVEILALLGGSVITEALDAIFGEGHQQLFEPALASELLMIDEGVLAFEHSLYRHAVLHSIGNDRAKRLTTEIAGRVASEPLRSMLAPGVVAAHLRLAPDAAPAEIVAEIHWEAGLEAYRAGAWGLAADHYETALLADETAESVWNDRAQRWYLAGEAGFRDHDVGCARHLERALDLAEEADLDVVASATILRSRALLTLGSGEATSHDASSLIALADDPDPRIDRWRSALLGMAAECRFATFDVEAGAEFAARARVASSSSADPLSTWAVEISEGLLHVAGLQLDEANACFVRAVDTSERAHSAWHEASSRNRVALVELIHGTLEAADNSIARGLEVARSCHHWAECSFGGGLRTIALAARGDAFVEAEAEAAGAMFRRTSYAFAPGLLYPALAYARATRGDLEGAGDALAELEAVGQHARPYRRALARVDRMMGGSDDVSTRRSNARRPLDLSALAGIGAAVGEAIDAGDRERLDVLAEQTDGLLERGTLIAPGWPHFFPGLRAELAVARGESDAVDHINRAIAIAARERLEFELVRLDLLSSHAASDGRTAAAHASAALRRSDRAGLLTGVVLSQDRLGELGTDAGRPIARAVLTTDIVSSTDLTRTLGDEAWLEVLDEHDDLIRSTVRRSGGVIFKHTGDGMFAWFATPADAVRATELLLDKFENGRLHQGRVPMRIRAGLALGSPLSRDDGDLFGMTVIEAARLCSAAEDGTGLASAAIADASESPLAHFGSLDLKGFDGVVDAYTIRPVGD